MMAVRLRSFKAAKYLLQSGVDAALKNEKAETVAMVVESKFEEILNERNHIRFLRVQAKSVRQMALSQADHTALASEPMIMDQIEQSYDLCMTLSKLFEIRLVNVQLVKIKKKLMEVEGLTLTEAELCELDSEQTIIESKALCEKLAESVSPLSPHTHCVRRRATRCSKRTAQNAQYALGQLTQGLRPRRWCSLWQSGTAASLPRSSARRRLRPTPCPRNKPA